MNTSSDHRYDAAAALKVCREYLKEAQEFAAGHRTQPPDVSKLVSARFPQSSIRAARYGVDSRSPYIAAVIEDRDAPEEERSERFFDPWYFVPMLLMELPGGRFRFDRSKGAKYFYLAYAGPDGNEGNHYLRRIIVNTSRLADTRQKARSKEAHYDYRRAALKEVDKRVIEAMGQETLSPSRTREDAIKFAIGIFKRQLNSRQRLLAVDMSPREYESLLRTAFNVADAIHDKYSASQPAQRVTSSEAAE
jgi:hypothetical protein